MWPTVQRKQQLKLKKALFWKKLHQNVFTTDVYSIISHNKALSSINLTVKFHHYIMQDNGIH